MNQNIAFQPNDTVRCAQTMGAISGPKQKKNSTSDSTRAAAARS